MALPLALFVAGIGTNDADDATAANDFAIFAKLLNRRSNFHKFPFFIKQLSVVP